MTFEARLTRLPLAFDPALGADACAAAAPWAQGDLARLIAGAAGSSPYLDGLIRHESAWLEQALAADPERTPAWIEGEFPDDAAALGPALRRAKRRVALYAALADLGGVWPLERVTGALTDLADGALAAALAASLAAEARRGRLPEAAPGAVSAGLVVLAMGKQGARELNYSSDIDLIFLFDEGRYGADDYAEARAGLIRATRRSVALINDVTAEGYVFRTDLRLRPDASVTPVCLSMEAAEQYYESVGRTWERAAYIKARPCAGDIAAGEGFLRRLTPFVWRRHLDFAAIRDTQDMLERIREHRGLHGMALDGRNLKLAPGGIREIEFLAQTRQLIYGGRDPGVRQSDTLGALAALAQNGWLPAEAAASLAADYRAHRELEHRLQMVHDAQTQNLPTAPDGWGRVAALMGRGEVALRQDIAERIARVSRISEGFFTPKPPRPVPRLSDTARETVARWRSYPALRSRRAGEIFSRLGPALLDRLQGTGRPDEALRHLDSFLRGLPAGVQIFSMLEANPALIDLLVDIAATAPALAEYLGRNSAVFDAVIGGEFFRPLPDAAALGAALGAEVAAAPDYEAALVAMRRWHREQHFRIGTQHLRGLIGGEAAGAAYAALAEAVLARLWPLVEAEFAQRHGAPPGRGAAVLGMGSLGAGWLTSGSDLDLIVIYDAGTAETSQGRRPLPVRAYYARLTQALVTALTAPMAAGRLYEVDMRLRPSGRQGPVATALAAFTKYQQEEAWTWEHLALTRARPLAGAEAIGAEVEAFRRQLLAAPRDRAAVLVDVAAMRARIAAARGEGGLWDMKSGAGGVQDIELFGQAAALIAGCPARDTPAQLAAGAAAGVMTPEAAQALTGAWRLQQKLRTALRLLAETPEDPARLGAGPARMIAREAGTEAETETGTGDETGTGSEAAAEVLAQARQQAADVIEQALPPPAEPGQDPT